MAFLNSTKKKYADEANFNLFVISSEGRNRTRKSTKIDDFLCRISSAISPFGCNDKL